MDKFFSDKSKAKSRGLAKIGELALAAADELLFKGEDGRWGYSIEAAEAKQAEGAAPVRNPWVTELPVGNGHVTVVSNGKKKVEKKAVEKVVKPVIVKPVVVKKEGTYAGYHIDKERPRQNGVTRPSSTTLCGQVWAYLDANATVTSKDLPTIAEANSWNKNNVVCEYYNWRKFNGIKGKSSK